MSSVRTTSTVQKDSIAKSRWTDAKDQVNANKGQKSVPNNMTPCADVMVGPTRTIVLRLHWESMSTPGENVLYGKFPVDVGAEPRHLVF